MNKFVEAALVAAYIVGGGFILTAAGIIGRKIFFGE